MAASSAKASSGHLNKCGEFRNVFEANIDIVVLCEKITEVSGADAVVNCTGPHFESGSGVARAISKAAGDSLTDACDEFVSAHRRLRTGYVHVTPAFLMRHNKHLLHVRSPHASENTLNVSHGAHAPVSAVLVSYYNLWRRAFSDMRLQSVATPLIGAGLNQISADECVNDLIDALAQFCADAHGRGGPRVASYAAYYELERHSRAAPQPQPMRLDTSVRRVIYIVGNDAHQMSLVPRAVQKKLDALSLTAALSSGVNSSSSSSSSSRANDEECAICLDTMRTPKRLAKCGHAFCTACIDAFFARVRQACPVCNMVYGVSNGDQPPGTMTTTRLAMPLPGFDAGQSTHTIMISYHIPSGVQDHRHPRPGASFVGSLRIAYLPDTAEGREVLRLLRRAFDCRLIFTVGQSRTTGMSDMVTWNDIHHKTRIDGGPTNFGYPDPGYLERVTQELAAKGIC